MASEGALATIGIAQDRYDSPKPKGNTTKKLGPQTFTPPVIIEAETSRVDLDFAIDGGIMAVFDCCRANLVKCIETATVTKFEFQVSKKYPFP